MKLGIYLIMILNSLMTLNVKSGLQNRIFTRKSLFDWKILLNFAVVNIQNCCVIQNIII